MAMKIPLKKLNNLNGDFTAYVKDESKNDFGTIKDRRNFNIIEEAKRLKIDKVVLITSGNNGYSLSRYAEGTGIKVVCIIGKDMSEETKNVLRSTCYQVIELNLNHKILRPEEIIAFARETEDEVIWEVTNSYEEYYTPIIQEIFAELIPDYIVVPVGSGGLFVSMSEAVEKSDIKTKIIGIGVQNTIHSYADKLSTPWSPYTKAIDAYTKKGNFIYRLSEQEIKNIFNKCKNIVDCEPSSSVVFAVNNKHKFNKNDVVVFVNSGKMILPV